MGARGVAGLLAAVLVVVGLPGHQGGTARADSTGPINLGFEDVLPNGMPAGWAVEAADSVTVVGEEQVPDTPAVTPFNGQRMVRLGTPKTQNESQATGVNRVTQTFTAAEQELVIAARILSWEFRDNDRVTIAASGASLSNKVTFFSGSARRECISLPCTFTVNGGKRGELRDSGWVRLDLTTTPGASVTLSYSIEGTANNSHATWGYFDDVNRPPVAAFESDPPAGKKIFEGSFVQLRDTSYDPDPEDRIIAWSWRVTGPGGTDLRSSAPDPSFIPPQDGTYAISLDVTSTDGRTRGTTSHLEVSNAPALVNALDVEVLPGEPVPFLARFLDAGWLDTHTVTTTPPFDVTVDVDAQPGLLLGEVTGTAPAATSQVSITVDDGDGPLAPGSTATTTVTEVHDPHRNDGSDTVARAARVGANISRLGWLHEPGAVNVFEVLLPGQSGPQPLLTGTEIVAGLDEVPADYDLVLLALPPSVETAPFQMAPFQMAPFQMAPFQMAPFQMATIRRAPFQMAPFQMAPFQMAELGLSPFQMAPFQMAPFQMSPFQMAPLSQNPFAVQNGTGGGDIDASELGIEQLLASGPPGLQVAGFSANRGLNPESVVVRVDQPGTRLFAVVVGADDAFSPDPYRLRLESSVPFGTLAQAAPAIHSALLATVCNGEPLVPGNQPGSVQNYTSGQPETLIVTQLDRLRTRATSDAEWAGFTDTLAAYATAVNARVVSLPDGAAYESWDTDPCSIDAANAVTDLARAQIRGHIDPDGDGELDGSWRYLVILGDDTVVPFRRTSSGAVIGDEAQYLGGSFLRPGSSLATALAGSQELTDDFYSDLDPRRFQSGELYLPGLATGRLVETPGEIAASLNAFLESDGRLDAATALVTAHDFLADGGATVAASLRQRASVVEDTTETWTADSLRCRWLGIEESCAAGQVAAEPDIVSPNSHWTHYASLSANGYRTGDLRDILTSEEVGTRGASRPQLVFTIGCHAGFSVPDDQSLGGFGLGIDPRLDFPQALARRQAVFVASTGFGLGETEGLAGTEQLLADFADELLVDGVSAGEALRAAKHAYLAALSTTSVYDVKSLVQQVLYGPPQYQVFPDDGGSSAAGAATTATASATATTSPSLTQTYDLQRETHDGGRTYWTVDGDVQITAGRPWQPRSVAAVPPATRGALITGGRFRDETGIRPVVTRPTMEWEQGTGDLDVCHPSWWPAQLTTVNDGTLVVIPGQFRCTEPDGRGIQRLYESLELELLSSTSNDRIPPMAGPLDVRHNEDGATITLPASDASGIGRIVVLVLRADGQLVSVEADGITPHAGSYEIAVPGLTTDDEFVVQVADTAGNVTTLTGRGANLRALDLSADSPVLFQPGVPATFTATLSGWSDLVAPVSYLWDFGDGTTVIGLVDDPQVDEAADQASFEVAHTYNVTDWQERQATLRVWDASGVTGTADVVVARRCDPTGDVSPGLEWGDIQRCGVTRDGDQLTLTMGLAAPISPDGTYRFEVDTTPDGKKSTVTLLRYVAATGSATGLSSLRVDVEDEGHTLRFRMSARELGVRGAFAWRGSVQSGVPGSPGDGIIDRAPDSGWLR